MSARPGALILFQCHPSKLKDHGNHSAELQRHGIRARGIDELWAVDLWWRADRGKIGGSKGRDQVQLLMAPAMAVLIEAFLARFPALRTWTPYAWVP